MKHKARIASKDEQSNALYCIDDEKVGYDIARTSSRDYEKTSSPEVGIGVTGVTAFERAGSGVADSP